LIITAAATTTTTVIVKIFNQLCVVTTSLQHQMNG